jgi:hypothetical protein
MLAPPNTELVLAGANVSKEVVFVRLESRVLRTCFLLAGWPVARSTTPERYAARTHMGR